MGKILGLIAVVSSVFVLNCSSPESGSNQTSYKLGAIGAFGEMVDAGVKRLALSAVMSSLEMDAFIDQAQEVTERNNVQLYRENDLIVTDLFSTDVAKDKEVLIIYQGNTLDAYLKLKEDKSALVSSSTYSGENRLEIARRFGRLLSYSSKKINSLLSQNTDLRTMTDFGLKATNVFLYYKDLQRATDFYTKTIGLELLAAYDNASILRIAESSFVILVDAAKGMHSADEPKTVALALLTNQLADWYDHIIANDVEIKYTYTPKDGGPHDGFVAIDPEGYLLEFETFKQHSENELFMQYLATNKTISTSVGAGLGFNGAITWLYYKDVLKMQGFVENVLGLELVADQGWAKIYKATDTGFIGLVDERRGMHKFTEEKAVTVSFIMDDPDGWFEYVNNKQSFKLRSDSIGSGPDGKYRSFVGYDPEGYFLEFDKFYEHSDHSKLMEYLEKL